MKLNHKLAVVTVAALMGMSPVLTLSMSGSAVQAATVVKGNHRTYGKSKLVRMTKTLKFVNSVGKKTSKTATKGKYYTIHAVKNFNGKTYYGVQSNLWLPATATKGTVTYKVGHTLYVLKSNGKRVAVSTQKNHTSSKAKAKSQGRSDELDVMTGGTGRELGAVDTGKGFRGATAPKN